MLMEDLNGKLLERAELIAHQEEIDILLEEKMNTHKAEYEFALQVDEIDVRIQKVCSYVRELKAT